MRTDMRKSVLWMFLLIIASFVIAWLFRDQNHRLLWPLCGIALGLVFETIRLMLRKCNKRKSNLWAGVLLSVVALFGIFSIFEPILLGIAAGSLLPLTIELIIIQIYYQKVISWEDIRKENE